MFNIFGTTVQILIYILIGVLVCMFLVDFVRALHKSAEARAAFIFFVIGLIAVLSFMSIGT
jgi:uncharacterized membrane protein YuzA (DUF378 family)